MSREALRYVEIDVPICANTYGVAPCTASVPSTGADKCFNCTSTCQDLAHFVETTATMRFAEDTGHNPTDIEAYPCIESVSFSPGRISLGQDLGQRSSVSVTFKDFPHSDAGAGLDPYYASRSYDPYAQGSFWGRFKARQPYIKGSTLRLIMGFVGDDIADMETRTFIVESFDGPAMDGRFTLTAKDPLKLLDDDRAQAPALSSGYLSGAVASGATTATLLPVGIGNAEYPGSGYVAIGGKEICAFTRSGDTLTLTRAQYNTTAIAHSANDRVQVCAVWTAEDAADILYDLFVTYGGVPTSFIPLATWQAETGAFLGQVYTRLVPEPTGVKTLAAQLILEAGLAVWWDDVAAQMRLQVLRAISTDAEIFDDASDRIGGTLQITEQPDQQVSIVQVKFAQRNPLEEDKDDNLRSNTAKADTTALLNYGTPTIQLIRSMWIPTGGRAIADKLAALQLGRFAAPPRKFNFDVFRAEGRAAPQLGAGCQIKAYPLQASDGTADTVPVQITRIRPEKDRWAIEAEEARFTDYGGSTGSKTVIYDSDVTNRNLRTDFDALYGAPAHGDTVTFIVNPGVKIGSLLTTIPAIDVGSWPTLTRSGNRTSGSKVITGLSSTSEFTHGQRITGTGIPAGTIIDTVNSPSQITLSNAAVSGTGTSTALTVSTVILNLQIYGGIYGCGGPGGRGRRESGGYVAPTPGGPGGTALYTRYPINLLYEPTGELGGGGAGGGGSATGDGADLGGGGGGSGAGYNPGAAGQAGSNGAEPGQAGTLTTGGIGGRSKTKNAPWEFADLSNSVRGGPGGNLGASGGRGSSQFGNSGAPGGAAGNAIDGVSYALTTGSLATLAGPQIN